MFINSSSHPERTLMKNFFKGTAKLKAGQEESSIHPREAKDDSQGKLSEPARGRQKNSGRLFICRRFFFSLRCMGVIFYFAGRLFLSVGRRSFLSVLWVFFIFSSGTFYPFSGCFYPFFRYFSFFRFILPALRGTLLLLRVAKVLVLAVLCERRVLPGDVARECIALSIVSVVLLRCACWRGGNIAERGRSYKLLSLFL